ncbi:MAG: polysaccharide export outer membrane protein [Porticoccaceae bacterium]|jgi:polysaccharide export outer membrane protein
MRLIFCATSKDGSTDFSHFMDEHRQRTPELDASERSRSSRDSRSLAAGLRLSIRSIHWVVLAAFPLLSLGCATFNDNHYYAGHIPAGYNAPPNTNPLTIDFAQLSGTVTDSDVIGKGDDLNINIAASLRAQDAYSVSVQVGPDGTAEVPMIGKVRMAGINLSSAASLLTQLCIQRDIYRAPNINVSIRRRNTNRILVVGAVKEPGMKEVPVAESDLLSILFYAGGLADDAGANIEIRNVLTRDETMNEAIAADGTRGGITQTGYSSSNIAPRSVKIDLVSAAKSGANDYFVGDRGVVVVEKVEPKAVTVTGLVRKPGRVEFPKGEDLTLLGAISLSGYTSSQVANKVFVIRQPTPDSRSIVIEASLSKASHDPAHNILLAPGDIVKVEHTPATILMEAFQIIRVGVTSSFNPLL